MKSNIGYKLLTQDMTSHGSTKWEIGVPKTAQKEGNEMCTDQVLHYYTHPLIAVFANPVHAAIKSPRLFEVEISECVASDNLKSACKTQTLLRELPLPTLTKLQLHFVAIKSAMLLPKIGDPWDSWAQNWIDGKDRTEASEASARAYACACARAYASTRACAYAYACAYASTRASAPASAYAPARASAYAPTSQIITFLEESLTNSTLQ